ncbi:MAG TPA: ergothioneine biosynthesis protein EgtB [Alphaproteobacteria bacterium]|nr:ergothioneine biosynthesis protein EgtB [Alphaproteobacteria bacterium]
MSPISPSTRSVPKDLTSRYQAIRFETEARAAPLTAEDQQVQSMPDCSPAKWHRAHTTWFFETFLLSGLPGYTPFDPAYAYLFNSYYEAVGPRHPRPARGMLTRPGAEEIGRYRAYVDMAMADLTERGLTAEQADLLELGLNHEQQHQELLLTDIKHAFSLNPLRPAYGAAPEIAEALPARAGWAELPPGIYEAGAGAEGFAFDNERPRHRHYLHTARVATRPVTNGEYLEFMVAGGYARAEFWLSDGWAKTQSEGWRSPLYWTDCDGGWSVFGLDGEKPLDPAKPVQHVSFYEAAAYAAWRGRRLPTEFEWEAFAALAGASRTGVGRVWEWTASAYLPYPGFRTAPGAVGEYNGKFMSGQMVLRGGSWATPAGHSRATYRNFFPPAARWQATGIRLAEDM